MTDEELEQVVTECMNVYHNHVSCIPQPCVIIFLKRRTYGEHRVGTSTSKWVLEVRTRKGANIYIPSGLGARQELDVRVQLRSDE